MNTRNELIQLLDRIPEEKLAEAIKLLTPLAENAAEPGFFQMEGLPMEKASATAAGDPLAALLATLVYSMTNSMYDLAADARNKNEKILANRLEIYRKKVIEGWEGYRGKQDGASTAL